MPNTVELASRLFRIAHRAAPIAALALPLAMPAQAGAAPGSTAHAPAHAAKPAKATPARKRRPARPAPAAPALSADATRLLAWITASRDNGAQPYIVIDKQAAALYLYNAAGEFLGQTPVLIGIGVGDDSSPGVGAKNLAEIGPAERTTPAGRFVARYGRAFGHTRVLWVDYADAVALHAVITTNKAEHRVARLRSPTADDNRITFGCINVAASFDTHLVQPLFRKGGVVYILPDTKPVEEVFPQVRLLPYIAAPAAAITAQTAQ